MFGANRVTPHFLVRLIKAGSYYSNIGNFDPKNVKLIVSFLSTKKCLDKAKSLRSNVMMIIQEVLPD